jgi:hypothetical protein
MSKSFLHLLALGLVLASPVPLLSQAPWYLQGHSHPSNLRGQSLRVSNHVDLPQACTTFEGNPWDTVSQTTFSYSVNGALTEEIRSDYAMGQFSPTTRIQYHYAMGGLDSLWSIDHWTNNAWAPSGKGVFEYDVQSNRTLAVSLNWNGTSWDTIGGSRTTYTYGPQNQWASLQEENYDNLAQGWKGFYRWEVTFDPQDKWDTFTEYAFPLNAWEPAYRHVDIIWDDYPSKQMAYAKVQYFSTVWADSQQVLGNFGPNQSSEYVTQNIQPSGLVNDKRTSWLNDQYGHRRRYAVDIWSGQAWETFLRDSTDYTYDALGRTLESVDFYWSGGNLIPYLRQVYASFFTSAFVGQTLDMDVIVYPNPAVSELHFSLQGAKPGQVSIALYDIQGTKRVETMAFSNGTEIILPLSNELEAGTFIWRANAREGRATGKVIVQR